MKKYKMVVSDFDGTLLRSDDTVSDYTREVIRAFRAAGGIFAVSTGRMYPSIAQRLDETGVEGSFPLMCYQGALIKDSVSGEVLLYRPLETETVTEILRLCERNNFYCQYYDADKVYVPEMTPYNEVYCRANRVTPVLAGRLTDYLAAHPCDVAKVVMIADPEQTAGVLAAVRAELGERVQSYSTQPYLVEAVHPQAGKGNGLRFAAKRYGIDIADTIAVGDERNDISMLQAAGLGVAMGNAIAEVKASADAVTDTNDNDGVAKLIEKYCL